MFMTRTKFTAVITLMILTGSAFCLAGHFSVAAEQGAPVQGAPPKDKGARRPAEKPAPWFPDGRTHDFGKVPRGAQCKHAFRIVNTSGVPLRIIALRCS